MPKFSFKSNARPSLFAYPPEVKPPTTVAPTKVSTAVLSISRKAPAPAAAKPAAKTPAKTEPEAMDIDTKDKEAKDKETKDKDVKDKDAKDVKDVKEGEEKEKEKEKKKKEPEPQSEMKENPGRVTLTQLPHVTFAIPEARYTPVKKGEVFGIVLLHDAKPGEPEEFVAPGRLATGSLSGAAPDEPEPEPPAPFQWVEA